MAAVSAATSTGIAVVSCRSRRCGVRRRVHRGVKNVSDAAVEVGEDYEARCALVLIKLMWMNHYTRACIGA